MSPNITCPRCRHRHPANRSCEQATKLAEDAAAARAEQRAKEEAEGKLSGQIFYEKYAGLSLGMHDCAMDRWWDLSSEDRQVWCALAEWAWVAT